MSAVIEILDADRKKLTEFGAGEFRLGTRSYCLTEAGDADFDVPRNNEKVCEKYLSAPNIIRILSSTGIPGWSGPIVAVDWKQPEWVNVMAESGETLLRKKKVIITPNHELHSSMTTGAFLLHIINDAIGRGMRGVRPGNIDLGGPVTSFASQASDIWEDIIPDLRARTGYRNSEESYAFWVDENGLAHWQPMRGRDLRQSVCIHVGAGGVGYTTPTFQEDYRPVVSRSIGLGNDSNWDDKAQSIYRDEKLFARFGLQEGIKDAGGNRADQAEEAAKRGIQDKKRTLDITVTNEADTWLKFWVGDIVMISESASYWPESGGLLWGCRITGLEIQEEAERMRVIGKEWTLY